VDLEESQRLQLNSEAGLAGLGIVDGEESAAERVAGAWKGKPQCCRSSG